MLPFAEVITLGQDDDVAPPRVQKTRPPFLDGGNLGGPESIAVREIALVPKQVGNDRKAVRLDVEQRMGRADRTAAEQPVLELLALRAIDRKSTRLNSSH